MPNLDSDVRGSLAASATCAAAYDTAIGQLRVALAERNWDAVEAIRFRMLAAVDGYVDHLAAAAKRVEAERGR